MSEKKDAEPMTVLSVQYTEDEYIKIDIGRLYCCGDLESRHHHICLSEREYNALGKPSIGDDVYINIKNDARWRCASSKGRRKELPAVPKDRIWSAV